MSLENKINAESKAAEPKTIKQVSKFKIVIKTLAVIMFIFGFSLTYNMPKKMYGVTWWELGAMAEGNIIENNNAMLKYLDLTETEAMKLTEEEFKSKLSKAYDSLEVCLFWSCAYWFACSALLFIHIKDKEIVINREAKE